MFYNIQIKIVRCRVSISSYKTTTFGSIMFKFAIVELNNFLYLKKRTIFLTKYCKKCQHLKKLSNAWIIHTFEKLFINNFLGKNFVSTIGLTQSC